MNSMKKILVLVLVLLLAACANNTNSDGNSEIIPTVPETGEVEKTPELEWDLNEMMNDKNALGQYGDGDNVNRYPDDELYELIQAKVTPLKVGEVYIEDFEKEDLYKRFYPISASEGVEWSYEKNTSNSGNNDKQFKANYPLNPKIHQGLPTDFLKYTPEELEKLLQESQKGKFD